jgi:hypothetical protein
MKKFLDILLIVLLTLLVINLFSDNKEVKIDNTLSFAFDDTNYTIPASVIVNVKNNTNSGIIFNTCSDLKIINS